MAESILLTELSENLITEDGENILLEDSEENGGTVGAGVMTIANNLTGDGVASYKYALKPKINERKNI